MKKACAASRRASFSETHALSLRTRVALARARADARSAAASLSLRGLCSARPSRSGRRTRWRTPRSTARPGGTPSRRRGARRRRARGAGFSDRADADDVTNDDVSRRFRIRKRRRFVYEASFPSRTRLLRYLESFAKRLKNVEMFPSPCSRARQTGVSPRCSRRSSSARRTRRPGSTRPSFSPTETHGEGAFRFRNAFLEALRAATPSVRARRTQSVREKRRRASCWWRGRARRRASCEASFLSADATLRARARNPSSTRRKNDDTSTKRTASIRYVAGSTRSCVTASGFFPEAERRPVDCAAAADGADVVVLLPTAATERGDCADAAAGSREVFPPRRFVADKKARGRRTETEALFSSTRTRKPRASAWRTPSDGSSVSSGKPSRTRGSSSAARVCAATPRSRSPPSPATGAARTNRRAPRVPDASDLMSVRRRKQRRIRETRNSSYSSFFSRNRSAGDRDRSAGYRRRRGFRCALCSNPGARRLRRRRRRSPASRPPRAWSVSSRGSRSARVDGADPDAPFRVTHARVTATLDPRGVPRRSGRHVSRRKKGDRRVQLFLGVAVSRRRKNLRKKKQPSEREPEPSFSTRRAWRCSCSGFGF